MQSIICITANAMATVTALNGLDEGARDLLAWRPETDIRGHEGYYLAAESMRLAVLPDGADVALSLSPADEARYDRHVSFPPELRGVVFSGAKGLPKDYERTLAFWSPLEMTADHDGAQHCQNLLADGDTITVLDANKVQHKIRLSGIDAPEKKQPFGNRSKESLSALAFDKTVNVETSKRDRYGRQIGKVLVDGRDVNLVQVERGMAWFYRQYQREQSPNDRRLYEAAEDAARADKRGLWRDAEAPVADLDYYV